MAALKQRQGSATVGDVAVATGLPSPQVEAGLRRMLGLYESHLEVDDKGELAYRFSPSFARRDAGDGLARALRAVGRWSWRAFVFSFKAAIMVTLVVYFLLFVVILIAAAVALFSRGSSSSSSSSSRRSGGGLFFWPVRGALGGSSSSGSSSSSASSRASEGGGERERAPNAELPFYKKVFAFVFGPEAVAAPRDPWEDEQRFLRFLRDRKGVLTAAELAAWAGLSLPEAEERAARLLAQHEGEARVDADGHILYTFERLMVSANEERGGAPRRGWVWEPKPALTGNGGKTNAVIGFLNAFNLVAAFFMPFVVPAAWPELQLSPLVWVGLSVFPILFSLTFFAVPVLRWLVEKLYLAPQRHARDNKRAAREAVYAAVEGGEAKLQKNRLVASAVHSIQDHDPGREPVAQVEAWVDRLAGECGADVEVDEGGRTYYSFGGLKGALEAGQRARARVLPDQLRLGKIVFSTAQDDREAELGRFDEALAGPQREALDPRRAAQLDADLEGFDRALGQGAPSPQPDDAREAEARRLMDEFERRLAGDAAQAAQPAQARRKDGR